MKTILLYAIGLATSICGTACSPTPPKTPEATAPTAVQATQSIPSFDADSAFAYVAKQLTFGPRVPGTPAQAATAAWLQNELKRHGASVSLQRGSVTAYDGTMLPIYNIVGSFNPEASKRILLVSHWDSRPVADQDADTTKRQNPVPAANDGASGVGVLLEIARQAGMQSPQWGIDIFLTDVEDYGAPEDWKGEHKEEHWALGTQYWSHLPHTPGYRANFGILLDMVGAAHATFYKEYFSNYYAGDIVNMIWKTAGELGYKDYFIDENGGAITDDHYFINRIAKIPTVDIIHTTPHGEGTFYPYWHTTEDTLDKIDPKTLQVVGETLLHILYKE